jgi:hypothetical protein
MSIFMILSAIKDRRPDLKLHGFGLKITSLTSPYIQELLETADSMAWSFAARKEGGKHCHWETAKAFADRVSSLMNAVKPARLFCAI